MGRCGAATISSNAKLLLLIRLKDVYASRSFVFCHFVDCISLCCGDKSVELKQRTRQPASQCYRSGLCCSEFDFFFNVMESCSAVAVIPSVFSFIPLSSVIGQLFHRVACDCSFSSFLLLFTHYCFFLFLLA